ncbi:hypothetical protein LJC14_04955, partial [Treponema sp. OttesenSCG-928-L16]|nr:hypothetical protein [Treponema sp. OttesenSCG-928-L16]
MALIRIDGRRSIGRVDRKIFSGFVEHLGRCIYGGLYEKDSPFADEFGFRTDVCQALKRLNPPVLRWPGGNFVSNYHWTDGIGPAEKRPVRMELAWHLTESNIVGTDEFLRWCEREGYEPYICINMGSGTLDEAQSWVEYCNGTKDTYWANLRRKNGHEAPYNVKYWALGNEMYGEYQVGQLSAEEYVKKARSFAAVMRRTDQSIKFISCGKDGVSPWDNIVIEGLAPIISYHSIHIYTGSPDYWTNVLAPHQAERALKHMRAVIDDVRRRLEIDHEIKIAYDEWNVWYRYTEGIYAPSDQPPLEEHYDFSDALAVAAYLNIFVRYCATVGMANLAQMVNVIAPIFTSRKGMFLQTTYHPIEIISNNTQGVALDVFVDGPVHELEEKKEYLHWLWPQPVADMNPFQVLDAAATRDESASVLVLSVINRDPKNDITAKLEIRDFSPKGSAEVFTYSSKDPYVKNSFENPGAAAPVTSVHEFTGEPEYTFPACS